MESYLKWYEGIFESGHGWIMIGGYMVLTFCACFFIGGFIMGVLKALFGRDK